MQILLDTALFSNDESGCVDSWAVLSEKTKELLPSYRFTIDNFDPMIDAFYPPEDLRQRKQSAFRTSGHKNDSDPLLNQVLAMGRSDDFEGLENKSTQVILNAYEFPAKQGKERFSTFCKSHYEYLCRKGLIGDDGNERGVSHYKTHWAAMKAFVKGENRMERQLEHIIICRGSSGKMDDSNLRFMFHRKLSSLWYFSCFVLGLSYNPSAFDSTNLLKNHLGVEYTSVYISDYANLPEDSFTPRGSMTMTSHSENDDNGSKYGEEERDELIDPCPSGHLHVYIDADTSKADIEERLSILNSKFKPNNIFIETQNVFPPVDRGMANITPITNLDNFTHRNFVTIFLHAVEVLYAVGVQAPNDVAERCARVLWLLCLFYTHLYLQQPFSIVQDKILIVAAKYLQHILYSQENVRYIHGKFLNQYLFNVILEFSTDSHQAGAVVKRVFEQVFRIDDHTHSESCHHKLSQELLPGSKWNIDDIYDTYSKIILTFFRNTNVYMAYNRTGNTCNI